MKKVFRIFLLFVTVFVMAGCSNSINSSNFVNIDYVEVKDKKDVIYNLTHSLKNISGVSFSGIITIKGEKHEFDGKVISRGTIESSVININYKNNSFYIKDGNVYINYNHAGANIVIKDTLNNFVEETIVSLENKGVKCNKESIYDIVKNKTIDDINLSKLINFVEISNGEYNFKYKNLNVSLNEYFLPENVSYENKDIIVSALLSYERVSISVPVGYNLFTLSIGDIKQLLKVENISDLIK